MKKTFKILGITLLAILVLLIAIPFAFQSQIKDMIKRTINDNVNAHVEFSDVSLSFIKSFPKAHVSISDLVITNLEPFKDETLVSVKNIAFSMPIKELFKSSGKEPLIINSIAVNEAMLTLRTDKYGNTNYDIAKKEANEATSNETPSNFAFDIQDYSIKNSALTYMDDISNMLVHISELNHFGKGIFSAENSELDTKTDANISFTYDSVNYLNNNAIKLDALIGLDLKNSKYTFKNNTGFINKLPIEFKGYVQLLENGQDIDLTFENPETDFKNFLALMPEVYSKNIEGVKTSGDFKVKGIIKGMSTDETIPTLDIKITSNNASFKYPDLPKSVENIVIDMAIKNTTGLVDDTYVDINTLNFKIDKDVFKSSASLKNITQNMLVNANIDGTLNLANLTKAYPIELENKLTGILKAKLNMDFDMEAIETNAYERIKSSGWASISGFVFSTDAMPNPFQISDASLTFNPSTISLNSFQAKTGESDLSATGTIKNLLGFILSDGTLQGNFNLNSNVFKVSDFMAEDVVNKETTTQPKTETSTEALKIPAFLDCTINAVANSVIYDNLNLKDVKGALTIKDQQATLTNLTSSLFDGALAVNGNVSTKNDTPTFNFNLGASNFDIAKSFKGLELLQKLAPIAKYIQGKLNTTLNLKGDLTNDFTPNLNSVSGDAIAELLSTNVTENPGELLSKLQSSLNFIDFKKLNINDLKTKLEFADGKVTVKPFQVKYNDIAIDVAGSHNFDKTMAYNAVFNVPAKYLGGDVNQLIGRINSDNTNKISIPVTANISGNYTSPNVKTDLTSGVTNLTKQLVEIEKQKLLNQGKDKAKDLLSNLISGNKSKSDSLKTQQTTNVKEVLGSLVGGSKTKTADSTKTTTTTNTVKNVLGGLLNKKKKATDTAK